jgi:hypothetical protein
MAYKAANVLVAVYDSCQNSGGTIVVSTDPGGFSETTLGPVLRFCHS